MSIRSAIIIKVRPEDIGKKMKFDPSKLPVSLDKWYYDTSRDKSKEIVIEKEYIGIYCHSDGYPTGVGNALKEKFNDYDTILNLIIGGACSYVWFDGVRRYADRKGERWNYLQPKQGDTPEEIYTHINSQYCYLFTRECGWRVNDYNNGEKNIGTEENPDIIPAPIFKYY